MNNPAKTALPNTFNRFLCLVVQNIFFTFDNTHLYSAAFTSIHLIATGVSCFLGAGLLSFLIYVYCQRVHKPSQESAIIHPTTPNHLNYKGNTTPKNEKYTPMEFKVSSMLLFHKYTDRSWNYHTQTHCKCLEFKGNECDSCFIYGLYSCIYLNRVLATEDRLPFIFIPPLSCTGPIGFNTLRSHGPC